MASLDTNAPRKIIIASKLLENHLTIPTTTCERCKDHAYALECTANTLVRLHHIAHNAVKNFQRKEEPKQLDPLMITCMASLYCINAPSLLTYESNGNFHTLTDEAMTGKEFLSKLKALITENMSEASIPAETNQTHAECGEIHYKLHITKYKTNVVANLAQRMLQRYLQAKINSGVSHQTFKSSFESFEAAALLEMLYEIDNNRTDNPHIMDIARGIKRSASVEINGGASDLTERTQAYQSRSLWGKIWNITELLPIRNLQSRIPELEKISADLISQDETQSPFFNCVVNNLPKNPIIAATPLGIWEPIDLADSESEEDPSSDSY
jgi:hypothetical protein